MAKKKEVDTSKPVDESELSEETQQKIYRLYGVNTAMHLLRPGAKWEISNQTFTRWEDDRPCPTIEEVRETQRKAQEFEDSINTIWKPEQEKEIAKMQGHINGALD